MYLLLTMSEMIGQLETLLSRVSKPSLHLQWKPTGLQTLACSFAESPHSHPEPIYD